MKRVEAIDITRGIALVAMVVGHVLIDEGFINAWAYSFQAPLFFFVSGLVFPVDSDGKRYPASFLANRMRKLMVPYLMFGLVAIGIYQLLGTMAAAVLGWGVSGMSLGDCLFGLLYGNAALPQLYFYRPLWFLPCLFVMDVLMAVFLTLQPKKASSCQRAMLVALFAIILSRAGLVYQAGIGIPLPWSLETACILLVFFAAGCCIRILAAPAVLEQRLSGTARRRVMSACTGGTSCFGRRACLAELCSMRTPLSDLCH